MWGSCLEMRVWRSPVLNRPVRSLSARGEEAIMWVANSSFHTGVQASRSFCMNMTCVLKAHRKD